MHPQLCVVWKAEPPKTRRSANFNQQVNRLKLLTAVPESWKRTVVMVTGVHWECLGRRQGDQWQVEPEPSQAEPHALVCKAEGRQAFAEGILRQVRQCPTLPDGPASVAQLLLFKALASGVLP